MDGSYLQEGLIKCRESVGKALSCLNVHVYLVKTTGTFERNLACVVVDSGVYYALLGGNVDVDLYHPQPF